MTHPHKKKVPLVLYAGDSGPDGPACYLLAILHSLKMKVCHISPSQTLKASLLRATYDAVILSDYSYRCLAPGSENRLVELVSSGAGLAMVGGWGSFSGPFGGWKGSRIEGLLPVRCLESDDRMNFPGGAHIRFLNQHSLLKGIPANRVPAVVGINRVIPKNDSLVLASVRNIISGDQAPRYAKNEQPLLVIDRDPNRRIVALTTDLAPHWCGGMLDWGTKTLRLAFAPNRTVQVGDVYVRFVSNLLRWLTRCN